MTKIVLHSPSNELEPLDLRGPSTRRRSHRKGRPLPARERLARDMAMPLTWLRRPGQAHGMMDDTMRAARARGAIERLTKALGLNHDAVMTRLGLTVEEIERIGPFNKRRTR